MHVGMCQAQDLVIQSSLVRPNLAGSAADMEEGKL